MLGASARVETRVGAWTTVVTSTASSRRQRGRCRTHTAGALNLYSHPVDGFDEEDVTAGTFLAAHIAVALAESQHADNLQLAGLSRTLIGQAQGSCWSATGSAPKMPSPR